MRPTLGVYGITYVFSRQTAFVSSKIELACGLYDGEYQQYRKACKRTSRGVDSTLIKLLTCPKKVNDKRTSGNNGASFASRCHSSRALVAFCRSHTVLSLQFPGSDESTLTAQSWEPLIPSGEPLQCHQQGFLNEKIILPITIQIG